MGYKPIVSAEGGKQAPKYSAKAKTKEKRTTQKGKQKEQ